MLSQARNRKATPHERQTTRLRRLATPAGRPHPYLHVVPARHAPPLAETFEVPPECVDAVLGNDVRMTWVNNDYCMEGIVHEHDGQSHVDPWGITWVKQGPFNQIAHFPLAGASAEELLAYRFPRDHQEELLSSMQPLVAAADEYFLGCDVSPNVFEMYWRLRGLDQAMIDMAAAPQLAFEMLGRCGDLPPSWPRSPATASPWIGSGPATTWPASAR